MLDNGVDRGKRLFFFSRTPIPNFEEIHHGLECVGGRPIVSDEMNMLALVKGEEKYIFLFDEKNRSETLRQLGKYASDPDLSFTWYDAAVLSQRISQEGQKSEKRFDLPLTTDKDELF